VAFNNFNNGEGLGGLLLFIVLASLLGDGFGDGEELGTLLLFIVLSGLLD